LTVTTTGNVGIGTTTPGSLLSLNGIANFTAATSTFYSTGGINLTGGGCFSINGICISGGGSSQWVTGGSSISFNTGNVGIGTTTPYGILSISNSATTAANTPLFTIASTTGGNGTSTLMTVLANGNIGVGTASPQYPLDIYNGSAEVFSVGSTGGPTPYSDGNIEIWGGTNYGVGGIQLNAHAHFIENSGTTYFTTGGSSSNTLLTVGYLGAANTVINGLSIQGSITGNSAILSTISSSDTNVNLAIMPKGTGNVGIGTTTPYAVLEVWGPDQASTTPFAVVNSASSTVFSVLDNGNATLLHNLIQSSDQRLKTNIQSLDASSSLAAIVSLNPVTFNWIDPSQGSTPQFGFVAQQVQSVFPNLVSTTSPTALTPDGTLSLDYIGLISPIVSAIEELDQELTSLASTVANFAESFTSKQITATNELCIADSTGQTCITRSQLDAMLAAASQSTSASASPSPSTSAATDTPPVIQINGDNPAIIQVGATYTDLGATITGPQADLNLGIATFVNGTEMSPVQIDTTKAATDTIDYVVTDQSGLTATSTRTVIIQAANDNQASSTPANDNTASTTLATSTSQ